MNHVDILNYKRNHGLSVSKKTLVSRATGSFYTHELIGRFVTSQTIPLLKDSPKKTISVVDPFAGDGRLICWLIEGAQSEGIDVLWKISLWDRSESALAEAKKLLMAMKDRTGINIELSIFCTNSFDFANEFEGQFDIVITNPPWEALKPDRRELEALTTDDQKAYVGHLRQFDKHLAKIYPHSQPITKFAGWGTNLSRVGLELSVKLLNDNGRLAIVLPSSTFADQVSAPLRQWVNKNIAIKSIGHFPAEARLFEYVDQGAMALVGTRNSVTIQRFSLFSLFPNSLDYGIQQLELSPDVWQKSDFCIPFAFRGNAQAFMSAISTFPTWAELENSSCGFWSGRELDETNINSKLSHTGTYSFIKGRMVGRFQLVEPATKQISIDSMRVPRTANMRRIAWRDVSRTTQRRRMQATMIKPGYVTGNSLNIALFENQDEKMTLALLAIVNSLVFELQVRSRSSTSHISLGAVRGVHIPDIRDDEVAGRLSVISARCLENPDMHEADLEATVAKEYGLTREAIASLLPSFPKITAEEAKGILNSGVW